MPDKLGCTGRKNADEFLATSFKMHVTRGHCENREISSKSNVLAKREFRASLSNDNCSAIYPLSSETLHAKAFTRTVVDIGR